MHDLIYKRSSLPLGGERARYPLYVPCRIILFFNFCLEAYCRVVGSAQTVVAATSLRDIPRAIDLTTGRDRRSEGRPGLSD
jgi:hypothetical protein